MTDLQTTGPDHLEGDEFPTESRRGSYCNYDGTVDESLTADPRTTRAGRILVIENDKALQKILRRTLVSEGYGVEFVANGAIGLESARKQTPAALIIDLRFPASQGCDLCRELMQAAPAIPFLVLSASPSIVDKVLFLEMGADDYIAVPFSPRELVARLRALRRRRLQCTSESFYVFGDVMVDFMKIEVVRRHEQIRHSERVPDLGISDQERVPSDQPGRTSEQSLGVRVLSLHPHRGQSHPQASTEVGERSG